MNYISGSAYISGIDIIVHIIYLASILNNISGVQYCGEIFLVAHI